MAPTTGTGKYEALLARCRGLEPVPTAVAHPCEKTALAGAVEAGELGLIQPILVGPERKLREIAEANGITLGQIRIVDATHSHDAAAKAVEPVAAKAKKPAAAKAVQPGAAKAKKPTAKKG